MKLLVILSRIPYPLEKGDKLRAYHQLRCLSAHCEIVLVALSEGKPHPEAVRQLSPFCRELHFVKLPKYGIFINLVRAFFKAWPLQAGYFYNHGAAAFIRRIVQTWQPDHVYCQLLRTAAYARGIGVRSTIDFQDTFSAGVRRRRDKASLFLRPFFGFEYKRLLRYEKQVFEMFGGHTLISAPDRELFPHPDRNRIVIVENGVDFSSFTPEAVPKKHDVLFTGNMGYPPNIDAAEFLARDIMPLVRREWPGARLVLAGASPHLRVKKLTGPLTMVTGWVDDMRPWYAGAKVFVAPMRMGTGLQNKLLEAMAMELPCVTTRLANDALGANPGRDILIGESAADIAGHIIRLLSDQDSARILANNGHQYVHRHFSWEGATLKLLDLFRKGN
jgi:glycosyltransferase involved in cell wall biosynthesis